VRDEVFFQGAFGYSVGLALPSDWAEGSTPFIADGVEEPLATGMTLHLPVAARVVGVGGVALSETVLVTETGCVSLTASERSLTVIV
jgi:Xaa-Pro dipeptidase